MFAIGRAVGQSWSASLHVPAAWRAPASTGSAPSLPTDQPEESSPAGPAFLVHCWTASAAARNAALAAQGTPRPFLGRPWLRAVARLRQASLAPKWPRALEAGRGSQGRQTAGAPASAASNPRCPLCQRRPGEGGRLSRLVARQVLSRGRPPGPCTPRWRGGWRQRPAGWPAPLATPAPGAARALIP